MYMLSQYAILVLTCWLQCFVKQPTKVLYLRKHIVQLCFTGAASQWSGNGSNLPKSKAKHIRSQCIRKRSYFKLNNLTYFRSKMSHMQTYVIATVLFDSWSKMSNASVIFFWITSSIDSENKKNINTEYLTQKKNIIQLFKYTCT